MNLSEYLKDKEDRERKKLEEIQAELTRSETLRVQFPEVDGVTFLCWHSKNRCSVHLGKDHYYDSIDKDVPRFSLLDIPRLAALLPPVVTVKPDIKDYGYWSIVPMDLAPVRKSDLVSPTVGEDGDREILAAKGETYPYAFVAPFVIRKDLHINREFSTPIVSESSSGVDWTCKIGDVYVGITVKVALPKLQRGYSNGQWQPMSRTDTENTGMELSSVGGDRYGCSLRGWWYEPNYPGDSVWETLHKKWGIDDALATDKSLQKPGRGSSEP